MERGHVRFGNVFVALLLIGVAALTLPSLPLLDAFPSSSGLVLTVSTDSQLYAPGSAVRVSGYLLFNSTAVSGASVFIMVTQNVLSVFTSNALTGGSGQYSASFTLPQGISGQYIVSAFAQSNFRYARVYSSFYVQTGNYYNGYTTYTNCSYPGSSNCYCYYPGSTNCYPYCYYPGNCYPNCYYYPGTRTCYTQTYTQSHTHTGSSVSSPVQVTFVLSGAGRDMTGAVMTVDSFTYWYSVFPNSFWWYPGSSHQITVMPFSTSSSPGKRYMFASWNIPPPSSSSSGGGDENGHHHSPPVGLSSTSYGPQSAATTVTYVAPTAATTITLNYAAQYYLNVYINPKGSGTVSQSSGWQNAGSTVRLIATPNKENNFTGWTGTGSGSYSGTANPTTVTMNNPITETANFATSEQP